MKTKHREIILLALALAMAFPALAGQMLCVDCCGSPRVVRESTACPCCRSPQEDTPPSCCQHKTLNAPTADNTAFVGDNPQCECVDVPQGFSATQTAEKTGVSLFEISKVPVGGAAVDLCPKARSALHKAPDHPPAEIVFLSSIILLI